MTKTEAAPAGGLNAARNPCLGEATSPSSSTELEPGKRFLIDPAQEKKKKAGVGVGMGYEVAFYQLPAK